MFLTPIMPRSAQETSESVLPATLPALAPRHGHGVAGMCPQDPEEALVHALKGAGAEGAP